MVETDSFAVKAMFKGGNIFDGQSGWRSSNDSVWLETNGSICCRLPKTVMAIPFQMLITDRSQVSDTTKWITELYCPIQK